MGLPSVGLCVKQLLHLPLGTERSRSLEINFSQNPHKAHGICLPAEGPVPQEHTYRDDRDRKGRAVGGGLTKNGGSCSLAEFDIFLSPCGCKWLLRPRGTACGLDSEGTRLLGKKRRRETAAPSLPLSLSLHLPGELQLVLFHRPLLRSQGLVLLARPGVRERVNRQEAAGLAD